MPKKKKPIIHKLVLFWFQYPPTRSNWPAKMAVIEDEGLFYLVTFTNHSGFFAIPCTTLLQAAMLFQTAMQGVRPESMKKDSDKIVIDPELRVSWDWIKSEAKNGKQIIQSIGNDIISLVVGSKVKGKLLNLIK